MQKHGLGLLPYFPLASGLLTGKYKRNAPLPAGTRLATTKRLIDSVINERNWGIVDALRQFAASRGHTMLELAMSWLASRSPVLEHHRRRHPAGAGGTERRRGRLDARGRGPRRDRSHHCLSVPSKMRRRIHPPETSLW